MSDIDQLIRRVEDIYRQLRAMQRLEVSPIPASIVTYTGTPAANGIAYFTGAGTVTGGSIAYSNSGTPTLAATTSAGMNFMDDGANLGIRIADNGNVGMSPAGTAPFSNIATLATYPGRGLHIKPQAGQRAVLILDSDSLCDMVMVHTGAGSNVKSLVYRNISGVYSILVQTDDGSSSTNLQVMDMATAYTAFGPSSPSAKVHVQQQTLGSEVLRLESVATNDDPGGRLFHNRVATTNNTQTTLHTFTIAASTTYYIEVIVVARRTGGVAGTAEDGAAYKLRATIKNVAGVATLIGGAITTVYAQEDQAGWDCTIDVTSNTARVRVTGATNNNITWHLAEAWVYPVSS